MSKKTFVVTVVIITYGHEKYIREALEGVLMQQYAGPIEFIIANDNSPDKTDEVVKTYFQEHPAPENFEIKYTRHPENKGMMPNFIWALEQATGKYIALCDGDDYWTDPLKLQKQVDFLENNEDYVACQHARTVLFNNRSTKIENFKSHIFTQCVMFRNNFDDYYNSKILTMQILNCDTFLEHYFRANGAYKYLDFNGAVYRSDGAGVFSKLSIAERRIQSIYSYQEIISFISGSQYPYKNIVLKKLQSNIVETYFLLAKDSISGYNFNTYIKSIYRYRAFNLLELKRVIKFALLNRENN